MVSNQLILDIHDELIVDNFAGGGGASLGIYMALGRHVDIAKNHDPDACALHAANHPQTQHLCEDVFKGDPLEETGGRPVGLAWFSPDCKHFSKAKGKKPRDKKIRGLAWVAVKWARRVAPRVIMLENVEEFQGWGPLLGDGTPCPRRKGRTFKRFCGSLRKLGYQVQWRELRACDYGAPTIRKRLFLVARRDGKPIVWPEPTHGDPTEEGFSHSGLKPWRTAAECIDWWRPCPSIFLTAKEARKLGVKRPLANSTMRRLAKGTFKFVINHQSPFIVPLTHQGSVRVEDLRAPFNTITGAQRGEKALAVPFLTEHANASHQRVFDIDKPMRTQCAEVKGGHFALATAFLAKHYTGVVGSMPGKPIGTITEVDHHSLVALNLVREFGQSGGADVTKPMPTVMPGGGGKTALSASFLSKFYGTSTGQTHAEPMCSITSEGNHIAEVRAFLTKYYGAEDFGQELRGPLHTVRANDCFGLVTVAGRRHQICDIGMRMLVARELYRGQGFPDSYIIEIEVEKVIRGKRVRKMLSTTAQVRMCGNSVCPPLAKALVSANVPEMAIWRRGEKERQEKLWLEVAA